MTRPGSALPRTSAASSVPGAANSPVSIPVTLTVGPAQSLSTGGNTLTFTYQPGGANPATQPINVTSTGGPITFNVAAATTSCGNFLTATPATATTPAPVTVGVNVNGLAAGTTCNGTVTISAPGVQPQVINVTLTVGAAIVPAVAAVVNAASSAPGVIAPGEIVTIYGTNIGPATLANYVVNANGSFATTVADTTVFFDNVPAPIIYARSDQTSVVVPFEVAGRPTVNVTIRRAGQTSASLNLRVVDYAPGMFTLNQQGFGQGAIVNQNGVVNGPQTPAAKGSVVSFYLTGAGLISTNPQTGSVVLPSPLPVINAPVEVRIGGMTATVEYKGAAPFNIAGLYQFNVRIPDTVGSGTQSVVVAVGGVPAQGNVTMSIQ